MTLYLVIWIVLAVIFAALEMATTQLVSAWFAVAAALTAVVTALGAKPWLQFATFALFSVVLLLATRPLVRRFTNNKFVPTNADRAIGETAIVLTAVSPDEMGTVNVNGQDWSAISVRGVLPVGARVYVHAIEGVKLIVEALPTAAKL